MDLYGWSHNAILLEGIDPDLTRAYRRAQRFTNGFSGELRCYLQRTRTDMGYECDDWIFVITSETDDAYRKMYNVERVVVAASNTIWESPPTPTQAADHMKESIREKLRRAEEDLERWKELAVLAKI